MSLWSSLFGLSDEQEETQEAYQAWRDKNPDNPSDDDFYGDDEPCMYRSESDGSLTPLSREEYEADIANQRADYYDDVLANLDDPGTGDNSGGGFFGWLCR